MDNTKISPVKLKAICYDQHQKFVYSNSQWVFDEIIRLIELEAIETLDDLRSFDFSV